MDIDKIKGIENRIGYSFIDKDNLVQALTTKSYAKEENDQDRPCKSQEEYQTHGETLLKEVLIVLLKEHGFMTPQQITEAEIQMENKVKLYEIFCSFNIPFDYFQKSKGEHASVPLYAETFESLICAIYLDMNSKMNEADAKKEIKKYIARLFEPHIANFIP